MIFAARRVTVIASSMLISALFLFAVPVYAGSLQGTWQSVKSGSLFHVSPPVPASVGSLTGSPRLTGAMVAVRTPRGGGRPSLVVIHWVKGMRGAQMRIGRSVGTLSRDGKQVRFNSGVRWVRVTRGAGAAVPAGWWSSSSGSVFMVTGPTSGGFFVANIKKISARSFVSRANWIKGMRGRQFKYHARSIATVAPGGRQIRVQGKKINTWRLLSTMGRPRANAVRRAPIVRRRARTSIAGRWRSSSTGVELAIPVNAGPRFDVVWQSANRRTLRKIRAQWVSGLRGTQLQFKRRQERVTCTWSAKNPNRLQVMGWHGRTTTFTRLR